MTNDKMLTKKEQIEELKAQIAQLEEELKREDGCGFKIGDKYYLATDDGETYDNVWSDLTVEKKCLNQGNIFRTEEEALAKVKRNEVETKLRRMANGHEFVGGNENYFIYYDEPCFSVTYTRDCHRLGVTYFKTKDDAQAAIDALGDDLKALLL